MTHPMPVPVTLVTGFLGAGKTTLVNHLLAHAGRRIAVIENEFGDVGVDGALVNAPRDLVFELTEGCICCTVRDDLLAVFTALAARTEELDHVLVETSGLATPGPVMQVVDHPDLQGAFRLAGVVTVVDAGQVLVDLDEVAACGDQIAHADLLLLNKADQVAPETLDDLARQLQRRSPLARCLPVVNAAAPLDAVFGLEAEGSLAAAEAATHDHHHQHQHEDDIGSVVAGVTGELDLDRLDRWLGRLLRQPVPDLLRMKGVLAVPGHPDRFVFHAVRGGLDLRPHTPWGADPRSSRIVFIGRGLDPVSLQKGLEACQAPDPAA